ncbi:MAG: iduronate-2-sulfatase, partial [Akkermansiaceae bacterium]
TLKEAHVSPRTNALSLNRGSHSLRTDRWAYMKYKNGDEELYDMIKDPAQFTNLATKEEHQSAKTELLSQLKKRLKSALLP